MTKKWARIINEETKLCEVGIGSDNEYYRQQGYRYIDVEPATNGTWYVKGYAPVLPYPSENEIMIQKLKKELSEYDYIGVKIATGCATIEQYAKQIAYCEEIRKQIRRLSGQVVENEEGAV